MIRTIFVNDIEPAPLSIRHPLGVNLDLNLTMLMQNGSPAQLAVEPQFVLLPRSKGGVRPYDMTIIDAVNGNTRIQIPGFDLNDVSGYGIELYTREANAVEGGPPVPTGLAAKGTLATQGSAYAIDAPLSIINMPMVVGPPGPEGLVGPQGEIGATGQRGSVWTTGSGAPTSTENILPGDMYLDEANGDVWRYDGAVWMKGTF